MNIANKLAKVQQKLKAPKSQTNNFGGYKYRNCEDILEALKPHLDDCVVVIHDDIQVIGDRVYVKATAQFSDGENFMQSTAFAREPLSKKGMDESQITGAASSYARKYALNGLFLIDDTKDADSHDNKPETPEEVKSRLFGKYASIVESIRKALDEDDLFTSSSIWFELPDEVKKELWVAPTKGGLFTTAERQVLQSPEFRKAYYGDKE